MNGAGKKKRVLFIIPSFRSGGAERVIIHLLRNLSATEYDLHLAVINSGGEYEKEIPGRVCVHNLHFGRVRGSLFSLISVQRKTRPDIIFSSHGHLNLLLIILRIFFAGKTKLIIRETSTPSVNLEESPSPFLMKLMYKMLYRFADCIICPSDYSRNDLTINFYVPSGKTVRIYNPVDVNRVLRMTGKDKNPFTESGKGPHLLFVGRLGPEKGPGRLLAAFHEFRQSCSGAHLWMIGSGPMEGEIKKLVETLSLRDSVHLLGFKENPFVWMKYSDLFILPSMYEGLPNVLLEAIACGCRILTTKHPGGTREIVEICYPESSFDSLFCRGEGINGEDIMRALNHPQEPDRKKFTNEFSVEYAINQVAKCFTG